MRGRIGTLHAALTAAGRKAEADGLREGAAKLDSSEELEAAFRAAEQKAKGPDAGESGMDQFPSRVPWGAAPNVVTVSVQVMSW